MLLLKGSDSRERERERDLEDKSETKVALSKRKDWKQRVDSGARKGTELGNGT